MQQIFIGDIVIFSKICPLGKTISPRKNGRKSHALVYIWKGGASFEADNRKTVKATDGQLVYIPKFCRYKVQYTGDSTVFVVVNFNITRDDGTPFFLSDSVTLLTQDDRTYTVANIMAKLEGCSAAQNFTGQLRKKELVYRLLSTVYSNNEPESFNQQYPQLTKGVILLKQTYLENIPIEEFAKESNMSISSFRQLFKKQYGMSPLQYRNRLRINRARELFEHDNCTVAEAAYASGFENVGYFCRYYKKTFGQTPKQTKNNI